MNVNNKTYNSENSASLNVSDILCSLAIGLRELNKQVEQLSIKQVLEETQLPAEIIEPLVREKFKPKRLNRPLLEGEIRDALSKSKTMAGTARYLGVHFDTLKKYCELYDSSRTTGGSENLSAGTTPLLPVGNNGSSSLWQPTRGTKAIK
jgi:hypothetical protein